MSLMLRSGSFLRSGGARGRPTSLRSLSPACRPQTTAGCRGRVAVRAMLEVTDITSWETSKASLSDEVLRTKYWGVVGQDMKVDKAAMRKLLDSTVTLSIANSWLEDEEVDILVEKYVEDGALPYDGFVKIVEDAVMVSAKVDELKKAYKLADTDKTGTIEPHELEKLFKDLGQKLTTEEVQKVFNEADTNQDGSLNFKEFLFMARTHLVELSDLLAYVQLATGPKQMGVPKSLQMKVASSKQRREMQEEWASAYTETKDKEAKGDEADGKEAAVGGAEVVAEEVAEEVAPEETETDVVKIERGIRQISSEAHIRQVLAIPDKKLYVLMVGFTFCRPCKRFTRTYEKVATRYPDICFMKMMGNESEETKRLAKHAFKLKVSPMFYFFKAMDEDSEEEVLPFHEFSGANEQKLLDGLAELLQLPRQMSEEASD